MCLFKYTVPATWVVAALLSGTVGITLAADTAPNHLPSTVRTALERAKVPSHSAAVLVVPVEGDDKPLLSLNAHTPMNPASTLKLVTTYAALHILGPAYHWQTEAFVSGALRGHTLEGDLTLKGSGDPKLVIENLWLLVRQIRGYGIHTIRGDVVVDRSAFAPDTLDANAFDSEVLRPYNATPDALLVNYKAVVFSFVPDTATRTARILVTPQLAGLNVQNEVALTQGPCGNWRDKLKATFSDPMRPAFNGAYPAACGIGHWPVNILSNNAYFEAVFRALWENAGGSWDGRLREGTVPPEARRVALHQSEPLAQVIRDINKYSNNVMARQLLLTLATHNSDQPGSTQRGARVIQSEFSKMGLVLPELEIDNGSGLSRNARISADSLARILRHAYASPWMPEFMSSLPISGIDGTMKKRNGAKGSAHIKTGLLADVRASAGYVLAASGKRYVLVALIHHPNARNTQAVHEALLEWVYRHG